MPPASVLAACALAGVDAVLVAGGPGALAAVVWGLDGVPPVDVAIGWSDPVARALAGLLVDQCRILPADGPTAVLAPEGTSEEAVAATVAEAAEGHLVTWSSALATVDAGEGWRAVVCPDEASAVGCVLGLRPLTDSSDKRHTGSRIWCQD